MGRCLHDLSESGSGSRRLLGRTAQCQLFFAFANVEAYQLYPADGHPLSLGCQSRRKGQKPPNPNCQPKLKNA